MRGGLFLKVAGVVLAVVSVAGCSQMTKHSNTMLFGTNTKVGLDVGLDATQVPNITVGFRRQEAVIMPLVANVAESDGDLIPCQLPRTEETDKVIHPCRLVARRYENNKRSAEDSYSVLASFGAKFSANTDKSSTGATGGLAQYFATGVAAQLLAAKGGAAVVSVGEAAKAAARDPSNAAAVASVVSAEKAQEAILGTALTQAAMQRGQAAGNITNAIAGLAASCVKNSEKKTAIAKKMQEDEDLKGDVADFNKASSDGQFRTLLQDIGTTASGKLSAIIIGECQ